MPPSLEAKFPPKTLLPSTIMTGIVRTVGSGMRMGGGGEASSSTLKRARKLQLYFEALLDPKEKGKEDGRMQGGKVIGSRLFWAMFATSAPV